MPLKDCDLPAEILRLYVSNKVLVQTTFKRLGLADYGERIIQQIEQKLTDEKPCPICGKMIDLDSKMCKDCAKKGYGICRICKFGETKT